MVILDGRSGGPRVIHALIMGLEQLERGPESTLHGLASLQGRVFTLEYDRVSGNSHCLVSKILDYHRWHSHKDTKLWLSLTCIHKLASTIRAASRGCVFVVKSGMIESTVRVKKVTFREH